MDRLFMWLATGFGSGYLPIAPGTWGSLVALPLHFLLIRLPLTWYAAALIGIFFLAVISAGAAEKIMDKKDPGIVVSDEIIGQLITLIGAPSNILVWLAGFTLFRLFDILKPWPVCFFDRHINGGLGIVLDDVFAGLYGLIALQLLIRIIPFPAWGLI